MRPKTLFNPAQHGSLVANFECGPEPWAVEVANWIKAPATQLESAARMIMRKIVNKIWLFCEDDGSLVGFTSLSKDNWHIEHSPGGSPLPVLHIPYFGLGTQYHGKKEPTSGRSYAGLIFEDLLYEAGKLSTIRRFHLGLHVHRENLKAIGFYERYGFKKCGEDEVYDMMIVDPHVIASTKPMATPASVKNTNENASVATVTEGALPPS